jgi:hypothetical protein
MTSERTSPRLVVEAIEEVLDYASLGTNLPTSCP